MPRDPRTVATDLTSDEASEIRRPMLGGRVAWPVDVRFSATWKVIGRDGWFSLDRGIRDGG